MDDRQLIRDQVLRGIALNREPGYHFTGNFLDISYDRVAGGEALLSLDTGPRCTEADGQMSLGAIAVLADLTLAATVRAGLDPATRLATVTMNLNFTGVPLTGLLEAAGEFQGFIAGAAGRQGLSRVSITTGGERACFGTGAFMVLKPPKGVELHSVPKRRRGEIEVPAIDETRLKRDERRVLERADATLTAGSSAFLRRFWGFEPHHIKGGASCAVKNGPHIGNRVGHAQGGFLIGMAAATAAAALPATWQLTGISAWYISPGEGRILRARSKIVHHGRIVSVVRTQVTGKHSRLVLDVTTTHAHRAA